MFDILNDIRHRPTGAAALGCRIGRPPPEGKLMSRAYNVIDADGHILEPLDLWAKYMDPKFRDRAPRLVTDNATGKEKLLVEQQMLGSEQGMGGIGGVGARQGEIKAAEMKYEDGRPGGFDPHKRIPDMDSDGIDAAFLYPSMGLFAGAVHDPALASALCRAYNRWLADYCKPYPDRLFGIAMLPMQSVPHAIEEMRFARKELGFKGSFIRPNPYNNKMIDHPDYEPFWAAAEDLDMAIGFHEGGSSGMPTVGIDRFEGRAARHIVSHTMEMMLACLAVIWGGVCERHPKIRIGFLESGGGWIAPWLDRMDRHFDDQGFNDSGLTTRPSDLFRISFEPVEGSLHVLADYIGPKKIMWATDYPHRDGFFPGAPDMVRKQLEGLSPATKHGVLAGGAMGFYGLN
jgi:predicted TIM-barrel fold metal-dependent hydrolase